MKRKDKKSLVPATQSNFARESAEQGTTTPGPSNAMIALFQQRKSAGGIADKLERKNLPQMVKAQDGNTTNIPVGGVVTGIIVDVVKSPVSTVKGNLIWLALLQPNPQNPDLLESANLEITFPATGAIRSALVPGLAKDDDNKEAKALEAMKKFKGFLFYAQRMPDKLSKDFGKLMTTWDVRLSAKAEADKYGVKVNS